MAPERKRPTRSAAYQHLLVEKSFNHEMMGSFSVDDGMYKKLNPFEYNESLLILEDQLKERFWEIIEESLTERQLQIINLLKQGKTQSETAKEMGVNQSSVTKSLHGNTEYSNKDKGKTSYGGICRKLLKIIDKDPIILKIKEQISDIKNNTWT